MGHGEREGLGELPHGDQAALLAVLLGQDVLLSSRQQSQPLLRRSGRPPGPVEAVEEAAADLVLLQHHRHRFLLIDCSLPGAAALRVGGQGALEFMGQAQVIDDQTARLVPEDPVDAGDGLHQPVGAHRLVHVHGVQAGRVEAGEPHVPHQHHLKGIGRVAEPLGQRFSTQLVADVKLPVGRIRCRARHHHLENSPVVLLVMPIGAQAHQLPIEVDADAAAHADHHRLAVHGFQALLEVGNDVLSNQLQPLLRPHQGFQLGPFGLQSLLALYLLALGGFLELRVDSGLSLSSRASLARRLS